MLLVRLLLYHRFHLVQLVIQSRDLHVSINDSSLELGIHLVEVLEVAGQVFSFLCILYIGTLNDLSANLFLHHVNFLHHLSILGMNIADGACYGLAAWLGVALIDVSHVNLLVEELCAVSFCIVELVDCLLDLHLKLAALLGKSFYIVLVVLFDL